MRECLFQLGKRFVEHVEFIFRHLRHLCVGCGLGDDYLQRRDLVPLFLDGCVRSDDAFGAREFFVDARDVGRLWRGIGHE